MNSEAKSQSFWVEPTRSPRREFDTLKKAVRFYERSYKRGVSCTADENVISAVKKREGDAINRNAILALLVATILVSALGICIFLFFKGWFHHMDCQIRPEVITASDPCDPQYYPDWAEGEEFYEKYPNARPN